MTLTPYRRVLAVPGLARILLVATLARIPAMACGLVLTLHVVGALDRGYGAAGVVTAAWTVGMALGGPWRGRAVDRFGVRAALLPSIVVELAFWSAAPWLPYGVLLPGAVLVGLFSLPVSGLTRQTIGVLVPEPLRRTAFALDSIALELSFMAGPVTAVLVVTQFSSTAGLIAMGVSQAVAGLALGLLNPPIRSESSAEVCGVAAGGWFTPRFVAVLLLMTASGVALVGTDVATVAALRSAGHTELIGLVLAAWGIGSVVGGVVYGALARTLSSASLVVGLAIVTMPLGLVQSWWVLAIALVPVGALCAPSVSATVADVSRLVPEARRGEALGWHSTAGMFGVAIGAPLTGFAIDHLGAGWGFATAGAAGLVLALVALPLARVAGSPRPVTHEEVASSKV